MWSRVYVCQRRLTYCQQEDIRCARSRRTQAWCRWTHSWKTPDWRGIVARHWSQSEHWCRGVWRYFFVVRRFLKNFKLALKKRNKILERSDHESERRAWCWSWTHQTQKQRRSSIHRVVVWWHNVADAQGDARECVCECSQFETYMYMYFQWD